MIHAYSEIYLDDAMNTLAEVFSYTPDARQADVLFQRFVMSGIAYQFGKGNPRYLNMPSQALFYEIVGDSMPLIYPRGMGRSPQYWCGYVLAYYQWYTGLSFKEIKRSLPPSKIIEMYSPLHEADISKFVYVVDSRMKLFFAETNLKRIRIAYGFTQAELANRSGVSLRSIQMYEQKNKNINKASIDTMYRLAKVLGCAVEDLIER